MNKIFLGAVFGLTIMGSAGASIISRGFFDEAMENYATNTALDLKANQTDLTALSNKIGTLPDGLTVANLYDGWKTPSGKSVHGLSIIAQHNFTTYDPLNDTYINGTILESGGYLEMLARLFFGNGYEGPNSVLAPFWYLTQQAMKVGEIPRDKTAAGMIDEINTKIGTLPDGITVQGMYEGWTDSKGVIHNGLNDLSTITNNIDLSVEGALAAFMGYENGEKKPVKEVIKQLFMHIPYYPNLYNFAWRILDGGAFPKFAQEMYGIPGYKGLVDLTKGVGDLPSGNFPIFPEYELLFPYLNQPDTYPTSLAELITAIYGYGNSETGQKGLLAAIIHGFPINNGTDEHIGIVPNFYLAKYIKDIAEANATKIGDLPTEYATVGAALTAMDAKITAKNLPSTSDDGQYVLTAKKVGETITYTWVKMDLTNEEQIQ